MTGHAKPARQHYHVTLAVLGASALAYSVSQTMVVPALPEIQHALAVSQAEVTWVLTVFLLTASVATPIVGRLGDMFGKERMLLVTLTLFGAGLLISALSDSFALLMAGRAVQGIGGAIFPLAFGIIRDEFPRAKVSTGIGLISATFGVGGGIGLTLSGVIVDHVAYEWIFWLALAVVAVAALTTHLYVPESPVRAPARIDWAGAALLSAGLATLLFAVSKGNSWGWDGPRVVGLLVLGGAILLAWMRHELRVPAPLVDMRMMRRRGVWTTNTVAFFVGFGMFSSFVLTPQFVQTPESAGYGFGASVTGAGLVMLPSALVMLVAGPFAGWLGGRTGSRVPLLLGTAVGVLGFGWLALLHDQAWQLVFGTGLLGVGIALAFAAMPNLIVDAVDQTETGVATGMNTIMRTIGGSLGGQIAISIVAGHVLLDTQLPAESGYTTAFVLSGVAMLVALAFTLAAPRVRQPVLQPA